MRQALLRCCFPVILLAVACGARQGSAVDSLSAVRHLAVSALDCQEVTVREVDPGTMSSGRLPPYIAYGCDHYAHFVCEPATASAASACAMRGGLHHCDPAVERRWNDELLKKQAEGLEAATTYEFQDGPCFDP